MNCRRGDFRTIIKFIWLRNEAVMKLWNLKGDNIFHWSKTKFSISVKTKSYFHLHFVGCTSSYKKAQYWIIQTRRSCRRMCTTIQEYQRCRRSLIACIMIAWYLRTKALAKTLPEIYFGTFTINFTAKLITFWSFSTYLWWHSQWRPTFSWLQSSSNTTICAGTYTRILSNMYWFSFFSIGSIKELFIACSAVPKQYLYS